jgi:hypothetical protein
MKLPPAGHKIVRGKLVPISQYEEIQLGAELKRRWVAGSGV